MLAHEFMRNALVAGSFVGLACGLVGYFVVLRAQVFAGDALSHVAFTERSPRLRLGRTCGSACSARPLQWP